MSSILVVENDPLSRELAERVLRAGGHRVSSVTSAEEALERIRSVRPDLVLMDLSLPGIDGVEAARRLGEDPETAGVPVAVLSAQSFGEDLDRAREAGCVDYLTKPMTARALLERVAAILASTGKRGIALRSRA